MFSRQQQSFLGWTLLFEEETLNQNLWIAIEFIIGLGNYEAQDIISLVTLVRKVFEQIMDDLDDVDGSLGRMVWWSIL